jgi:Tol biopolymer transport system component/tRNA A-37 threonylcarbamoyl transferase component Bud32
MDGRYISSQPISHYEILEKLGEGGMGVVWKARDTRLNRLVAIKTLPAGKLADEGRQRRFIQEAQAASALNDPNIVTIYEIASENGTEFIAMEYVDGKTLGQLIPKRGMRLEETLRYAIQMAGALAKAHAAGIVHRDLKPGNIMINAEGRVKLLDFGLAKLTEANPPGGPDEDTRTLRAHSEEGTIAGTAAYMSPEQAEGKPVDARSDIFSFGAVLYEMATGTRAFHGDSKLSTLSAVLRENPKPPSQVAADVPRELDRIIARCLRKDPARRFQAMPDLKVALEELKEESDSGTAEVVAGGIGAPVAKPRFRLMPAAATATLLVAVAAAWFFLRPASKPLPPMQSVPLTTYTGSQGHASFSPDGSQVAFQWTGEKGDHLDIYVKLVEGGTPLRLTTSPESAASPAWSPDGRQIAFLRAGGVYSVSPLGGPERKLTDVFVDSLAWMPDSQSLMISSAKSAGELHSIFQLSLRTGEMRPVTTPPPADPGGGGDYGPAVSPDGRTLGFLRWAWPEGGIYLQPLAGGPARRLTKRSQQVGGLVWASNREILCYGTAGVSGSMWRMFTDGRSEEQPVEGALDGAREPAISHPPNGPVRLAYTRFVGDSNIWRMAIAPDAHGGVRAVGQPASIIASTRADRSPRFSPDGKRIVFASDRDGYLEIWVAASDGSGPAQLTTLKSSRSGSPRWSPNGTEIVFDSPASGNSDIWMVRSEGGPARQLTTEPSIDARPSFSRDGRWIYFRSDRSGAQQIWKMPSAAPFRPAVQLTHNGGFDADEAPDGKLLYYTKPQGGLWNMPVEGGEGTLVLEQVRSGLWSLAENGIYYLDVAARSPEGATPIVWLSSATHKLVQVGAVRKPIVAFTPDLSVTSDGRRIAWAQVDREESELMLIENFR